MTATVIVPLPPAGEVVKARTVEKTPEGDIVTETVVPLDPAFARRHLLALTDANSTLSENEMGLLTENLCNLLALASAKDVAPPTLTDEYVKARLSHNGLKG